MNYERSTQAEQQQKNILEIKMKKKNKGDMVYFDDEERKLIESIEEGEWKRLPKALETKKIALARKAARNTMRKDARVNLRMTKLDLMHLKAKAAAEGIPYQTLLTALVHKYVSGTIKIL
jgi:predicted DNA binding CopG/RHH family protein